MSLDYLRKYGIYFQVNEVAKLADPKILESLQGRRKIYGDIMQNVDLEEVEALLLHFNNDVPKVEC